MEDSRARLEEPAEVLLGEHAPLARCKIVERQSADAAAMQRIARALHHDDAANGLYQLAKHNGAPVALRDIGMQEKDIDRIAHIAVQNPYWNPRPVNTEAEASLRALLQRAWQGAPPA